MNRERELPIRGAVAIEALRRTADKIEMWTRSNSIDLNQIAVEVDDVMKMARIILEMDERADWSDMCGCDFCTNALHVLYEKPMLKLVK